MKKQVSLPADLRDKFELTKPLFGGPVFDLPQVGMRVDFSRLDEKTAVILLKRNWPGIRRVEKKRKEAPAQAPETSV